MSKKFSCRLLLPSKAALVTVPFDNMENKSEGLKAVMQKYGFCIVTNVASVNECKSLQNDLEADHSELIDMTLTQDVQVVRAVKKYSNVEVCHMPSATLGTLGIKNCFQLRGLPHGHFAWQSRILPHVHRPYEILHGTADLVSSCDNSFVSPLQDAKQEKIISGPPSTRMITTEASQVLMCIKVCYIAGQV